MFIEIGINANVSGVDDIFDKREI